MSTLFDDIEEEALKVEDSEIEEVITVGEHKSSPSKGTTSVL